MSVQFNSYTRDYAWMSNFSAHSVVDEYGDEWPTAEHAYQAAKTLDPDERKRIRSTLTAASAKRAGKHITMRPGWPLVKVRTMHFIIGSKLHGHPQLIDALLATGQEELVHLSPWDGFWGTGADPHTGQNWLGRIYMEWRDAFADAT